MGPITCKAFRSSFLDTFFPREKKEAKLKEFINICKGGMSVQEYSLKFTKLSKYEPFLVSNLRVEISRFVMVVSDYFIVECRFACSIKTWIFLD